MGYFLRSFSYADSRRVVVSYKGNYVHKVLVNREVKPAQEKVWIAFRIARHDHHSCWLGRKSSNKTKLFAAFYFVVCWFFKSTLIKFIQEYHQSVKQFGSRSGVPFWVHTVCNGYHFQQRTKVVTIERKLELDTCRYPPKICIDYYWGVVTLFLPAGTFVGRIGFGI